MKSLSPNTLSSTVTKYFKRSKKRFKLLILIVKGEMPAFGVLGIEPTNLGCLLGRIAGG